MAVVAEGYSDEVTDAGADGYREAVTDAPG